MFKARTQILENQKFQITRELEKAQGELEKYNKLYEELRIMKIENLTLKAIGEKRVNFKIEN